MSKTNRGKEVDCLIMEAILVCAINDHQELMAKFIGTIFSLISQSHKRKYDVTILLLRGT